MPRLFKAFFILGFGLTAALWAQRLLITPSLEEVRIAAPDFHFLSGKSLDQMRNGNAVAFDFLLVALNENRSNIFGRSFERYVISYDLWEQSYSVSRMRSRRGSASHLSAPQVESWCIDNITLPASMLPKDEPLFFRLEVRPVDSKSKQPVFPEDEPLSLATLIDIFSRAGKVGRDQWKLETGPIRLRAAK